jgi:hypothetical protein
MIGLLATAVAYFTHTTMHIELLLELPVLGAGQGHHQH